jgi:hypothetical protein
MPAPTFHWPGREAFAEPSGRVICSAPRGGGYLFDLMGSCDFAWKIGALVGLVASTMRLLMDDRPTARMQALQAATA